MSKRFLPFLLLLALTGWHTADPAYQKITLDDHYNNVVPKGIDPKSILRYKVNAAKGLILDCSKYDFAAMRQMNGGKNPDYIHLISAKSGSFEVGLNAFGQTVISSTTAVFIGSHKKFHGFQKTDSVIMGIGTIDLAGGKADLRTYWVAWIDVK